jgi:hypothetical protein
MLSSISQSVKVGPPCAAPRRCCREGAAWLVQQKASGSVAGGRYAVAQRAHTVEADSLGGQPHGAARALADGTSAAQHPVDAATETFASAATSLIVGRLFCSISSHLPVAIDTKVSFAVSD